MLNPLEVEQRFQYLISSFSYPSGTISRLYRIEEFLRYIGPETAGYESYVFDAVEWLPQLLDGVTGIGTRPEQLDALYRNLTELRGHLPILSTIPSIEDASTKLQHAAAILYAYSADMVALVKILQGPEQPSIPDWVAPLAEEEGLDRLTRLSRLTEAARRNGSDILSHLVKLLEEWRAQTKPGPDAVFVPVVEKEYPGAASAIGPGGIRRITLNIFGRARRGEDCLFTDVHVVGVSDPRQVFSSEATKAAKALLRKTHPLLSDHSYEGHLSFEPKGAAHEGSSANLAIAALFYSTILHHTEQRGRFRLTSSTAISGNVSEHGDVLEIDDEALRLKVQSIFYSPFDFLVVPKKQVLVAEEEVARLSSQHRHRTVTIIGVSYLQELFFDRRIADFVQPAWLTFSARRMWKRKYRVLAGGIIVFLLVAIARIIYGPLDRIPTSAGFEGELMKVRNRSGQIIEEIAVGRPTVRNWGPEGRKEEHLEGYAIGGGDEHLDAQISYLEVGPPESPYDWRVRTWSITERREIWSVPIAASYSFPGKREVEGNNFCLQQIKIGNCDSDPFPELVVVATHGPSFPAVLTVLDARDGKVKGQYIHVGHIMDLALIDLHKDGAEEIVVCGVNTPYEQAFVASLDGRFVNGSSPSKGDYYCDNPPPACEQYYVLIPSTEVGRSYQSQKRNNSATRIDIAEGRRGFIVRLDDGVPDDSVAGLPLQASLVYDFTNSFVLTSIAPSDQYRLHFRNLQKRGLLKSVLDDTYLRQMADQLQYWDGETWRSRPMQNKRYAELCTQSSVRPLNPGDKPIY